MYIYIYGLYKADGLGGPFWESLPSSLKDVLDARATRAPRAREHRDPTAGFLHPALRVQVPK